MVYELKIKKRCAWSGLVKYKHCFDYIGSYWTRAGSRYTGLTPKEEKSFEEALGYPKGELSRTSPFWDTFNVKVGGQTVLLDDQYPRQAMIIRFLSSHKRVATSLEDTSPGKDYLLVNKETEARQENVRNRLFREAVRSYDSLDLNQMRQALRILGFDSYRMTNEVVESELFSFIRKNPQRYLDYYANNSHKDTLFLIENAVVLGVLKQEHGVYLYEKSTLAPSLESLVLVLEAPENVTLRDTLIAMIKRKNSALYQKEAASAASSKQQK